MFEPGNRSLLTDLLHPPHGYSLEQAVGTTFTVDLTSALMVPLSFATGGVSLKDDVGIIASLADFTDRITIFAQAGEMGCGVRSDLIALLEEVIYPVQTPVGVFHPKVWLLEYAKGSHRCYRFLCLSRNLTEDRSWDLCVRLDGTQAELSRQERCLERNRPLVDFLEYLPSITTVEMEPERLIRIQKMTARIGLVDWDLPEGVRHLEFRFMNGVGAPFMDRPAKDALIISPFVTKSGLKTVRDHVWRNTTLVSRPSSIDRLPETALDERLKTYVLDSLLDERPDPDTGHEASDEEQSDPAKVRANPVARPREQLTGLHAKAVFIRERRRPSRSVALIGSANITRGGLYGNVEMMVELHGHTSNLGPDAVLRELLPILEPHETIGGEEESALEEERRGLEGVVRSLAAGVVHAKVLGEGPYDLAVWTDDALFERLAELSAGGIEVQWRLYSRPTSHLAAMGASEETAAMIGGLQLTEITPFLSMTAAQQVDGQTIEASTLVLAQIHGDIARRHNAILAEGIGTGGAFIRLLMLLLDPYGVSFQTGQQGVGAGGSTWSSSAALDGLFESLMKSLARGDDGLETIHGILTELRSQSEGALDLPEGFEELWENVWRARNGHDRGGGR